MGALAQPPLIRISYGVARVARVILLERGQRVEGGIPALPVEVPAQTTANDGKRRRLVTFGV